MEDLQQDESNLNRKLKIRILQATVVAVMLYGCESWSLSKKLKKELDGSYTRMLRKALNVSWKQKVPNTELYGDLPKISDVVRERRLRLAGHCMRHKNEVSSNLVIWRPSRGSRNRGRPTNTFVDTIMRDTGLVAAELRGCMTDRDKWRFIVVRAGRSST